LTNFQDLVGKKSPDNNSINYDFDSGARDNILYDEIGKGHRVQYIQRYTFGESLAEAAIISGEPKFLVTQNGKINIINQLKLNKEVIRPLREESYLNKAYVFGSSQDVQSIVEKCERETISNLYDEVKFNCIKYIDADSSHINLLTANILYTYSQDRIGLTPYLFFVGRPSSGKSNNLTIINALGYRNYMSTDMTPANIYQFLGSVQEGQGTLCIDEADSIDTNNRLMQIFKNGYTKGFSVAKTDISNGRKQERYFTFGFKAFASESLPDATVAAGFNDRLIIIYCFDGNPEHDIAEVLGDDDNQNEITQLSNIRNKLLIYRLLHYCDPLPNYHTSLQNREKQLFKPVIRLFHEYQQLWQELEPAILKYVRQRRNDKFNSLYYRLYSIVSELIKEKNLTIVPSSYIWNRLKEIVPGENIPYKTMSYNTEEYGVLSQKRITEILVQVFGATKNPGHDSANKLVFDQGKVERTGKMYEQPSIAKIEVVPIASDCTSYPSRKDTVGIRGK
jgi:hypothetical protein